MKCHNPKPNPNVKIKIIGNDNDNMLGNVSNYKHTIENSVTDILTKFVNVVIEYMRFISEKIRTKNKCYYHFIFERGLETIIHIFSLMLHYTKNIDITFYYTQKAYYCYIEFIEQITDENAKFLQLSSRDAILFVYKKTLFELNNDYIKNKLTITEKEKHILLQVSAYVNVYKNIIMRTITHTEFNCDIKIQHINLCCNQIEQLSISLNQNKIKSNYIYFINLFIHLLADNNIELTKLFKILDDFIHKIIGKKIIDETAITTKLYGTAFNEYIEHYGLDNIVNWLLTNN